MTKASDTVKPNSFLSALPEHTLFLFLQTTTHPLTHQGLHPRSAAWLASHCSFSLFMEANGGVECNRQGILTKTGGEERMAASHLKFFCWPGCMEGYFSHTFFSAADEGLWHTALTGCCVPGIKNTKKCGKTVSHPNILYLFPYYYSDTPSSLWEQTHWRNFEKGFP